jgi:uncharacterized protein YjbI with pentapeptide repeats
VVRLLLRMAGAVIVDPPDLPELERRQLPASGDIGDLQLEGALVERSGAEPLSVNRVRIAESELCGVTLEAGQAPGLRLTDALLRECDLSNLDARGGSIRRTEVRRSRMVGFNVSEGTLEDLRVVDTSLALASFAFARLRNVVFERVNLAEASFMQARLQAVEFIDCTLAGTDFRGAQLHGCVIRGSSLDGVLGVDSLAGLMMPWADVVASAAALEIAVEAD